ncbi:ABC transporter ATP-binding protein [Paenibacillus sp. OV219]|uniref:ABC transporter ATP-binding protein n=1 Tax=Paenibacillus sp. OV219 TaxID=1884377 RepID=UPI0008AE8DB1|nr:ABC transporter ATP-binding protein [Paenibacillus sp. OV219]SEN37172.1 ATP-binding cassette, subfamily B [Paenibacillus sp. OV219]
MQKRSIWRNLRRGYGIVNRLTPKYIPLTVVSSFIKAVQPLMVLFLSAQIINELAGDRDTGRIVLYTALTVGLAFILSAINAVVSRRITTLNSTLWARFYFFLGHRYMQLNYDQVEDTMNNENLADIEAKTNGNGLGLLRLHYSLPELLQPLFELILSIALFIGMFTAAASYEQTFITSPVATVLLVILILLILPFTYILKKREERIQRRVFEENPKSNTYIHFFNEYMQAKNAAKDIRLYRQAPAIEEHYNKSVGAEFWYRVFDLFGKNNALAAAINAVLGGCVYLFIGLRALYGMYPLGSVVQYIGAANGAVGALAKLVAVLGNFITNNQYLNLVFDYLDLPDNMRKSDGNRQIPQADLEFEFHDVSFKYSAADNYAIKNLSMKFNIGERLAVVGLNGSGKTTMIKLLCRLYEPSEGVITLNGIDIREYDYSAYMGVFSVVFQDFKLFSFSLGHNVATSENYDADLAEESLIMAGFGEKLKNMQEGLGTFLHKDFSDDGVDMSGGEAQKVALARALYKNAPFVVLDEPTAALDPIAEFEIYSRFNELIGGKTAIFVSHRLSSCRFCHDIVVFHEGRLIQRGSHDELLADRDGKYAELWNAQAQYYVSA